MIKNLVAIFFACLPLLFFSSCQTSDKLTYELRGVISGVSDGHVLYMTDEFGEINLDSTVVNGNNFHFTGELSSSPMSVWIVGDISTETYKQLWLEPGEIFIDASNTTLKEGKTKGSKSQQEAETLQMLMKNANNPQVALIDFIQSHPNSIVSVYLLDFHAIEFGKHMVLELYNTISNENRKTKYGKRVLEYLNLNRNPRIGDRFADFKMMDTLRQNKYLSNNLGKLTLLDFWASSCGSCRLEHPNLVNAYGAFHARGFSIVSISNDTNKRKWLDAIKQDEVGSWLHLSDLSRSNRASLIYGINSLPSNFLINENGVIIAMNLRGEELTDKLEELLLD